MPRKKTLIFLSFLFLLILNVNSQASVAINDYRVYIINNGNISKINVPENVSIAPSGAWRNHILFDGIKVSSYYILNIDNNILSERLPSGPSMGYFTLESNNKSLFYVGGYEYELNPITMRIANRRRVREDQYIRALDYDYYNKINSINWELNEVLGHRSTRFHGENFSLEVI